MEKKNYIKPELEVVMLAEETCILAGSPTVNVNQDEEIDEVWSGSQTTIWDDTESTEED